MTATAPPARALLHVSAAAVAGTRLMRARPSDSLVANYHINTRFFYAPTVYQHTDAIIDLVTELGARGVRERLTTGTSVGNSLQKRALPILARRGIRWQMTVGQLTDWQHADRVHGDAMRYLGAEYRRSLDGDLATMVHSIGGVNEIDGPVYHGQVDPNWARHARVMQRSLWQHAKSFRATRTIPVAGPSTRTDFTAARARELGDLSECSEWGNGHLYQRGTSATRGLDDHLEVLRRVFPQADKMVLSETGYCNSPQDDLGRNVPEFASSVYAVRAVCDFFKRNALFTRFELLDDPNTIDWKNQQTINATAQREHHFGLVAMTRRSVAQSTPDTWRKKPEFHATKRLLTLLADAGPRFVPQPLGLQIDGATADLQTLLLQKRSGRHYLALWRDVEVATCFPEAAALHVEPVRLRLRLGTARPVRTWIPNQSAAPVRAFTAGSAIRLRLGAELTILEIG
jgi:hypothetical protein